MNRYRKSDALIIVGTLLFSITLMVLYLNVFKNNSIIMNVVTFVILLIPVLTVYILFTPLPTYFNVLDFMKSFLFYQSKQKRFKWEGIHKFDQDGVEKGEPYEEGKEFKEEDKKSHKRTRESHKKI